MRVSINGKPAGELTPALERSVQVKRGPEVAEGVVRTPEETVASVKRGMQLLYGVACGVGGLVMLLALAGAASYEPGDLLVVVPLVLVLGAGLGFLIRFVWRRNIAKAEARAESSLAAPGVTVRVEETGLTIGAEHYPWSALTVDEVGILVASTGDSTTESVERLTLSGAGRSLVLDMLTLTNGALIVTQAWRRLSEQRRG